MKLDGVILTLRILLGKEKQGRKFIYILERKNSQKLQMRWENVCVGKRLFFNVLILEESATATLDPHSVRPFKVLLLTKIDYKNCRGPSSPGF